MIGLARNSCSKLLNEAFASNSFVAHILITSAHRVDPYRRICSVYDCDFCCCSCYSSVIFGGVEVGFLLADLFVVEVFSTVIACRSTIGADVVGVMAIWSTVNAGRDSHRLDLAGFPRSHLFLAEDSYSLLVEDLWVEDHCGMAEDPLLSEQEAAMWRKLCEEVLC